MDAPGPICGFEVFVDAIPLPKTGRGTARLKLELTALQPVMRDFAFVVKREVTADAVVRAAAGADKVLIADARVFDIFEGGDIPAGHKSVAIEVMLQPKEATLTDADIEAIGKKIVANVAKQTGGSLRT
jgi:phenylalanyl-tRNA synthetase beta chain